MTLSKIIQGGPQWDLFRCSRRHRWFGSMIVSAGYDVERSPGYRWNGKTRGQKGCLILQYTLEGEGMLRYESTSYRLPAGSMMLVHVPHNHEYWLPRSGLPWKILWVTLTGDELKGIWLDIERNNGPVHQAPPGSPVIRALADIIDFTVCRKGRSPFEASLLAYTMGMRLAEIAAPQRSECPPEIENAARFAAENFGQSVSVENMAAVSGLSRHYFTRLFEETKGIPPGEYLRQARVKHAMDLLRNTGKRVGEIARQCGMNDTSYFCRMFRRRTGFTPGEFRKGGGHRAIGP